MRGCTKRVHMRGYTWYWVPHKRIHEQIMSVHGVKEIMCLYTDGM